MEEKEQPEKSNWAGLTKDQIAALRDMGCIREGRDKHDQDRVAAFKRQLLEALAEPDREMKGSFGFDNGKGGTDYINVENQKDFLRMVVLTQGDQPQIDTLMEIEEERRQLDDPGRPDIDIERER